MICECPWETLDPPKLRHQKISVVCVTVPEDEHHFAETLWDEHALVTEEPVQCRSQLKHSSSLLYHDRVRNLRSTTKVHIQMHAAKMPFNILARHSFLSICLTG